MEGDGFSGRVLIRIPPALHQKAAHCALEAKQSLNEFITQSILEGVDRKMAITYNRVVIGDLPCKDVRDAAIVTQHPWFMTIFNRFHVYFFNPKLGQVTPMRYLLCYETTLVQDDGSKNANPRHIAKWGHVREILFGLSSSDFATIPDLIPITKDPDYWSEISTWESYNVVILDEIGDLAKPLYLKDGSQARFLINKTTDLPRLRNAAVVEDLYA